VDKQFTAWPLLHFEVIARPGHGHAYKELDANQTLYVFASENGPQGETFARWATRDRRMGNSGHSAMSWEATEVLDPKVLIRPLANPDTSSNASSRLLSGRNLSARF
jgi:hypothetical protein